MTHELSKILLSCLLALALALGFACSPAASDDDDSAPSGDDDDTAVSPCDGIEPELIEISPAELNEMMVNKDFQLINVHIPYAGELDGTDVHVAYNDVDAIEEHLGEDVGAKAVLYCLTGPMSAIAGDDLVERGYCQIYDMPAGMVGWEAAGFPISN
jgi:rhodanese-related sulfurtransferase